MTTIKSCSIMEQIDYNSTMQLINEMLLKTNIKFGSVQIGQIYAKFYLEQINKMLISEYINIEILNELKLKVKSDLEFIRNDCNRRIRIINVNDKDINDNNYMMSMILDFILSL